MWSKLNSRCGGYLGYSTSTWWIYLVPMWYNMWLPTPSEGRLPHRLRRALQPSRGCGLHNGIQTTIKFNGIMKWPGNSSLPPPGLHTTECVIPSNARLSQVPILLVEQNWYRDCGLWVTASTSSYKFARSGAHCIYTNSYGMGAYALC